MADQCVFLSEAELEVYLADGWTIVSGPYSTPDECMAACAGTGTGTGTGTAGGGVTTSCCPGASIPAVLQMAVSGLGNYAITYNPATNAWEYAGAVGTCPGGGSGTTTISLTCNVAWQGNIGATLFGPPSSLSCDPLVITFTGVDATGCGGSASATVTVTP
jgi:hypothetical protein